MKAIDIIIGLKDYNKKWVSLFSFLNDNNLSMGHCKTKGQVIISESLRLIEMCSGNCV